LAFPRDARKSASIPGFTDLLEYLMQRRLGFVSSHAGKDAAPQDEQQGSQGLRTLPIIHPLPHPAEVVAAPATTPPFPFSGGFPSQKSMVLSSTWVNLGKMREIKKPDNLGDHPT
jgi:hypothetical protein